MERRVEPGRRIPDPKNEPNFYQIAKDRPLSEDSKKKDGSGDDDDKGEDDRKPSARPPAKEEEGASAPCSLQDRAAGLLAQPGMQTSQGGAFYGRQLFSIPSFPKAACHDISTMFFGNAAACMSSSLLAHNQAGNWPSFAQLLPSACQHCYHAYLSGGGNQFVPQISHGFVSQNYPNHVQALQCLAPVHDSKLILVGSSVDGAYHQTLQDLLRSTTRDYNLAAVAPVASLEVEEHEVNPNGDTFKADHNDGMVIESDERSAGEESETEETQFIIESLGDAAFQQERSPSIDLFLNEILQTD